VRTVLRDTVPPEARRVGFTFRHDALLAFRGDSTLQIAARSRLLVVLDPNGNAVRSFLSPVAGASEPGDRRPVGGVDGLGRLVYAGRGPPQFPNTHYPGDSTLPIAGTDSAPIFRGSAIEAEPTLVGRVKVPAASRSVYATITVAVMGRTVDVWCPVSVINPVEIRDDWVVLADGSVAFIRATDSHVDWTGLDGSRQASQPLVPNPRRISEREKSALVDSARVLQGALTCRGLPANVPGPQPQFVDLSAIPDYLPAFVAGQSWADADGRVWVEIMAASAGVGATYAIVDRARGVVDRIRLARGDTIVGFGPGVVYLTEEHVGGVRLVKARIRGP